MRHDHSTSNLILDVDGSRDTTKAFFGLGLRRTRIGGRPELHQWFEGKVDNVFIFRGFLTDDMIANLRTRGEAAILSMIKPGTKVLAGELPAADDAPLPFPRLPAVIAQNGPSLGLGPTDSPKPPSRKPLKLTTNSIGMKLVLIPEGKFWMGSPDSDRTAEINEKPQLLVRITRPFNLGVTEVTRGQFRRFVDDAGYQTEAEKDGTGGYGLNEEIKKWELNPRNTWRNPGFEQTDEHPVVHVSWNDAVAFAAWLGRQEGKRLPAAD